MNFRIATDYKEPVPALECLTRESYPVKMLKTYRYRIYPTKEQSIKLSQFFGCSRFVANWALETKLKHQIQTKDGISRFSLLNLLPELKYDNPFLADCHSQVLQESATRVHVGFTEFCKGKKGCPKWKSRKNPVSSISYPQGVKLEKKRIFLPKIGSVKIKLSRDFVGAIKTVTVSRVASGKHFVSVLVEDGKELPEKVMTEKVIGLDFGIKDLVIASDGTKWNYGANLAKAEKNVIRYQKKLSKKTIGSANFAKTKTKLAQKWEKVAFIRNDILHKISHQLVNENQAIALEDLAVKNMVKNHKLARSISRMGWSTLRRYLAYKADWQGKTVIAIGRFEPSSKLCSSCGAINRELTLKDRVWQCDCGVTHDRDINAARNIAQMSLKQMTVGTTATACGEGVALPSLKQESPPLGAG